MKLFGVLSLLIVFSFHAAAQTAGFTPLIEAVTGKKVTKPAIDTLIENGADVNTRDKQGRTALMLAAMHNPDPGVIYSLIKNGAKVNARTPDTGQTALFFAVQYSTNPEIVILLLNKGADQNIKDVFSKTAYDYMDRNPKIKGSNAEMLFNDYVPEPISSDDDASR